MGHPANPQIQSWSYLPRLLTTHVWSQKSDTLTPLYRPLFSLWLLVIYSLVGAAEWVWHAASIRLYALTTFLVYRLAVELLQHRLAATFTALIFAVHPIHIEPVCWVSACNELLVGPLIAVSLLLFLRERRINPKRFWSRWTLLSLGAFTAALFAKESVLPLVVNRAIRFDYGEEGRIDGEGIYISSGCCECAIVLANWTIAFAGVGLLTSV